MLNRTYNHFVDLTSDVGAPGNFCIIYISLYLSCAYVDSVFYWSICDNTTIQLAIIYPLFNGPPTWASLGTCVHFSSVCVCVTLHRVESAESNGNWWCYHRTFTTHNRLITFRFRCFLILIHHGLHACMIMICRGKALRVLQNALVWRIMPVYVPISP